MKKTISITIAVILCSVCFVTYKFYNAINVEETSTNKIKQNNNMLSMMIETEARSGKYELTTSSTWPTDGYVFNSELSKCENSGTLSWDDTNKKVVFEGNNIDKCYVYFNVYAPPSIIDYCTGGQSLSSCITTFGNQDSDISNIYVHDENLENGAGDNSYRFAGTNPNNYVCFGSDNTTCPYENLYRIIGLIDGKVKLILADGATTDILGTNGSYAMTYQKGFEHFITYYRGSGDLTKVGSYKWNSNNTWSTSALNTANLNTNFLTYLDEKNTKWKDMIDDTTWYVGGSTQVNVIKSNAKTAYDYEVGVNKDTATTVTTKIGLMYISDYYYGAIPDYWTLEGGFSSSGDDYRKAYSVNWLSIGLNEWTISRCSNDSANVNYVEHKGGVVSSSSNIDAGRAIRPTFNLTSSVQYDSGSGTSTDPIRIKL